MKAKHNGKCPYCAYPIETGNDIEKGPDGWGHAQCVVKRTFEEPCLCNRCGEKMNTIYASRGICGRCIDDLRAVTDWTPELVREWLAVDNRFLERAVARLFERQTEDERVVDDTRWLNRVGFSAADAKRLSKSAKWLLSGNHLSGWFLAETRNRMLKYSKQLCEVIYERKDRAGGADREPESEGSGSDAKRQVGGRRIKIDFSRASGAGRNDQGRPGMVDRQPTKVGEADGDEVVDWVAWKNVFTAYEVEMEHKAAAHKGERMAAGLK